MRIVIPRSTIIRNLLAVCPLFVGGLLAADDQGSDGGLTVVRDGQSEYVIVMPYAANLVERRAAYELQKYLAEVTGATLPVLSEEVAAKLGKDKPRLVVGDSKVARELLGVQSFDSLARDAIIIRRVGRDLVFGGHPRRGTLYAVYTFLEDVVGVRWWTSTETHIPPRRTLDVPPLAIEYAPKVSDRSTRWLDLSDGNFTRHTTVTPDEQRRMGIFSARMRLNGHDHYSIPEEFGGRDELIGWVHTFSLIEPLLPVSRYFDQHPEWYSLIDGKRQKERSQLCLTNAEMRAELTRVVKERLRARPGATVISVSQNDWHGNCQCADCKALDDKEGGTPAGSLIHFINAVAEDVEKEFPHVFVETLAYQYSRTPPKHVRPRHNVLIRLCSIECAFAEPLATSTDRFNVAFRRDMEGWSRISKQIYIWDYTTNFVDYFAPHPNFHVLAPNLRYFARHGAIGIFEQGDSGNRTGYFVRLKAWYLAHLLWNPDADEKQLFDTFMTGYYGAAAPHLARVIEIVDEAGRKAYAHLADKATQYGGAYLGCYIPETDKWLTLEALNQAAESFDRAAAAVVGDAILTERVRRERMPIDYIWLKRYAPLREEALRKGVGFHGPADPQKALAEFRDMIRKHNSGEFQQGGIITPDTFGNNFPLQVK